MNVSAIEHDLLVLMVWCRPFLSFRKPEPGFLVRVGVLLVSGSALFRERITPLPVC